MATKITEYQCPACTAPLRFDSGSGRLTCDYCGASYEVSEMEARYAEMEAAAQEAFGEDEERQTLSEETPEWDLSGVSEDWG